MNLKTVQTIVKDLRIRASKADPGIDAHLEPFLARQMALPAGALCGYRLLSRSVDSRKGEPVLLYQVLAEVEKSAAKSAGLLPALPEELAKLAPAELPLLENSLLHPIVVGTGPAGIFGALALALAGCRPIVLDRGPKVETRCAGQEKFLADRELDEENNLLIGEGGAGTFSDGKLYTGTRDASARFVQEELIRCGAPPEIGYHKRPHAGSDKLPGITRKLRERILALGGEFRFGAQVTDVVEKAGRCVGVKLASGEVLEAPAVLIAPGLGGRDLVRSLMKRLEYTLKPFQIGCRVEHPQRFIDRIQYHGNRPAALEAAEYHLLSRASADRPGVSTFCMCPGGEVVNASAWKHHSITNGMSRFARDGEFANSCLITTLPAERFASAAEVYALFDRIEAKLFTMGGSDYTLPAQDVRAFLNGQKQLKPGPVSARVGVVPGRLDELLPAEVRDTLRGALRHFDRMCPGFIEQGKLIGVESCVSAPVRFLRTEEGCASMPGVFLAGEGVGAAGGIVSAACDGIRCALKMMGGFAK